MCLLGLFCCECEEGLCWVLKLTRGNRPLVGNAAEHLTAVTVALKNKMELSIGVALGSSIQIALLVGPVLVLTGWISGSYLFRLLINQLTNSTQFALLVKSDNR